MSGAPLLQLEDLSVTFTTARGAVRAVDSVSLSVGAGEIVGLVGESGSGKSVTLRAVTRLLGSNARISGRALWRGGDLLAMKEKSLRGLRGREIAMIFQEPMTALNPVLTIGRQIDESLAAHSAMDGAQRRARARELLDLVGIASGAQRLGDYPHQFSGGMRQRAMIAIALAAEPKLLLADEPTTALDVTIQDQILRLLSGLTRDLGMAMVLVTHDLGVVAQTCERVCVMYAGRIVEAAPAAELFARPRHAYTHALLRSMPDGGPARQPLTPIPGQPPRAGEAGAGCAFTPRCAFADARCAAQTPPMLDYAPGHSAACWQAQSVAAAGPAP